MAYEVLSSQNPVFLSYLFYVGVLVVKMMLMSLLTTRQRLAKGAFASAEDVAGHSGKVKHDDPDVERVRRAHLNDLENIPLFIFVAFGFLFTNPSFWLAATLFRTFTLARIVHTIVYAVIVLPQPARGISWMVGEGITAYMAVIVTMNFLKYA